MVSDLFFCACQVRLSLPLPWVWFWAMAKPCWWGVRFCASRLARSCVLLVSAKTWMLVLLLSPHFK